MVAVFVVFFLLFGVLILLPLFYAGTELAIVTMIKKVFYIFLNKFFPVKTPSAEKLAKLAKQQVKY